MRSLPARVIATCIEAARSQSTSATGQPGRFVPNRLASAQDATLAMCYKIYMTLYGMSELRRHECATCDSRTAGSPPITDRRPVSFSAPTVGVEQPRRAADFVSTRTRSCLGRPTPARLPLPSGRAARCDERWAPDFLDGSAIVKLSSGSRSRRPSSAGLVRAPGGRLVCTPANRGRAGAAPGDRKRSVGHGVSSTALIDRPR